jgi:rhodanese-related sulfurtransferase
LPEKSTGVDDLLAEARRDLKRLSPRETLAATSRGAVLIDIRSDSQRAEDGVIPSSAHVARNVLEWRLDPGCEHRDRTLSDGDRQLILLCNEGYQSSLAAATIRSFGVDVTDVIGGFQAWREAGLPVTRLAGQPGA